VSIGGVEKDVCPGHPDNAPGKVHFEILSRTTGYGPVMRLFGHIGSMILNMHRDNAALRTMWNQQAETRLHIPGARQRIPALNTIRFDPSGDQPLSFMEWIKMGIEHEVDTRSIGLAASLIRLTKGRIARLWRRQVLLLTTRGRKSGQERTVPLQFFPDGGDMIVVAANSGLSSPPGWYFNLTADPLARVEVGDRTLQVRAEELSADQAVAVWSRVLQVAPDYARYPRRTSRRIPLIRLVPIRPGEAASP
jgi:deazaflavin-dependent oxidoreductase (nitroreductase family)